VKAVVAPYDALGGAPVLEAVARKIPVIAVKDNQSILNVTPQKLAIESSVLVVDNYLEAAGALMGMKDRVDLSDRLYGKSFRQKQKLGVDQISKDVLKKHTPKADWELVDRLATNSWAEAGLYAALQSGLSIRRLIAQGGPLGKSTAACEKATRGGLPGE
jgi:transposase-like protein